MDLVVELPVKTLINNLLINPEEFATAAGNNKISPAALSLRLEKSNIFFTFILNSSNTFRLRWNQEVQQWEKGIHTTNISSLGDVTAETNQINLVVFRIRILYNCPGQQPICKELDTYLLKIHYQMINNEIANPVTVNINFTRNKNSNNTEIVTPLLTSSHDISIDIIGQTLLYGTDIGNTIFIIKDNIATIYDKCDTKIFNVVIGTGNDLYDKLNNIYTDEIGVPLTVFYSNLFLYAMLKYILAKLLYHKFNTKYLLRRYNRKFLTDLSNSRYKNFLIFFTECVNDICIYDYNRYFLE